MHGPIKHQIVKEVLSVIRGGIHGFHGDPTGCKTLEKPEGDHIVFGVSNLQIIRNVTEGLLRRMLRLG